MGFVIGEIKSVKRKVEFDLLADDGKRVPKADMVVTFRVRTTEESKKRAKLLSDFTAETQRQFALLDNDPLHVLKLPDADFDANFLREDIENIEGLLNPDKTEIEFSADVLEQVLLDRLATTALILSWSQLNLRKKAELKRKN